MITITSNFEEMQQLLYNANSDVFYEGQIFADYDINLGNDLANIFIRKGEYIFYHYVSSGKYMNYVIFEYCGNLILLSPDKYENALQVIEDKKMGYVTGWRGCYR
ncbi:hypothetical protein [Listeria welshimeri]|uniref:hypothetical protein n=1 Tax=Listeria welshimeri TaxID=1643 RepID=UPI0016258826|nr:hypothetical protein [Listeria welshimeri]MBC1705814.1 hypothetical protein [Listeria welshimeri]MBF2342572.1 hypothetical protein [Listeria welshimeri]